MSQKTPKTNFFSTKKVWQLVTQKVKISSSCRSAEILYTYTSTFSSTPRSRITRDGEIISEEIYFGREKKEKKEEIFEKLPLKFEEIFTKNENLLRKI